MLKKINLRITLSIAIFAAISFSACKTQKIVYLRDVPDEVGVVTTVTPAEFKESVIQVDDILNITIKTIDPVSTEALNQAWATMSGGTANASGYLVDKDGSVEIPILGIIKLAGLTTSQARDKIRIEASKYYKEPNVQVRYGNYKFTIIGDVNRAGTFTIPNEKFSVLDALGTASDLAISAKRTNVMLIRENDGKKDIVRLDLTSTALLKSPYYYIKQNDVIYVEPGKAKVFANNASDIRYFSLAISIISIALSVYLRLR